MQIRRAEPKDETEIEACARAAYEQYVTAIGRPPAPMLADFAALIAAGHVYVYPEPEGSAAGRILGYVIFLPDTAHMQLDNVATLPEAKGKGIGRALINFCEEAARHAGLKSVQLYTNAKMTRNLTLYPYLGYEEVDRRWEAGFDRVYFEKHLR
jgi:ribosomal protein S18 acetylase RimI-like enzyme